MPLTLSDQDKVDVRRHTGYGAFGSTDSSRSLMYWHFFPEFTMLEYRMNNLADEEVSQIQIYLSQCNQLETDMFGARENLDTAKAAVWTWNDKEVHDRMELYTIARKMMLSMLMLPPGPFFIQSSASPVARFVK